MSAARILLAAVFVVAGPAAAELSAVPGQAVPAEITPRDVEKTHEASPYDNTVVKAGQSGLPVGCTPGPQPFVEKVDAAGARVWIRTANADLDCDGDGQGDGEGEPLFAGMTSLDPAYVQAGTIQGLAVAANGEIYATGQILIAWQSGSPIGADSTWGAFVLRLAPDGRLLGDAYVGVEPPGPPAEVENCAALCATLAGTAFDQYAGRGVAVDPAAGVGIAGWWRAASIGGVTDQDLFFARFTLDLTLRKFLRKRVYPGDDAGLGIAFDAAKHLLVTGYFGPVRDIFAARFQGVTGELLHLFTAGGPWDDEGREIAAGGEEVEVRGCFTQELDLPGQTLEGGGPTAFAARLTPELEFKSATAEGPCGGGEESSAALSPLVKARVDGTLPPPPPPPPPGGTVDNPPKAMVVATGSPGNCACEENPPGGLCVYQHIPGEPVGDPCLGQVTESDDTYLHVYGEFLPGGLSSEIEIEFDFEVDSQATVLNSLSLELNSDYCTTITVSLGGGDAAPGEFHEAGTTELCPLDEPIVTVPIPSAIAAALGFTGGNLPVDPLKAVVSLVLVGQACEGCASGGQDSHIDTVTLASEYP